MTNDSTGNTRRTTRSFSEFRYNGSETRQAQVKSKEIQSNNTTSSSLTGGSKKRKRAKSTIIESSSEIAAPTTQPSTKVRRKPARKIKNEDDSTSVLPPTGWQDLYETTQAFRATIEAPVDTMGCERLADTSLSPRTQRFQTLISLMLSSQTKDAVTAAAIRRLQSELPGGLTLESILAVEPAELDDKIGKVGFHNVKTKNIKRTAELLRDAWDGDIPATADALMTLPGVGPKMAHLTMSAAWGITEGIGVDVHVHRITNLWKWHATRTPEETRTTLQAWLPRKHWHEINWLLVGLGQTICGPVTRKCGQCLMGIEGLCPAAPVGVRVKKEAKVEIKIEEEVESL